jgi:ATP-dependent RNA helicase RhlE
VATDIAARGIDVDELTHVINYELPNVPETYVHRIGRTGRAGLSGIALSFCEAEELPFLKDIQKLIGREIKVDRSHIYHVDYSGYNAPKASKPANTHFKGNQRGSSQNSGNKRNFNAPKNNNFRGRNQDR